MKNRQRAREPLNKATLSTECQTIRSEPPQIVRAATSDSSRSYGRVASRARCGFSGACHNKRQMRPVWHGRAKKSLSAGDMKNPEQTIGSAVAAILAGSPPQ